MLKDDTGQDLPDLPAARQAAVRTIADMIAEHLSDGKAVDLGHRVDIEDGDGRLLDRVVFKDLFVFRGRQLVLGDHSTA